MNEEMIVTEELKEETPEAEKEKTFTQSQLEEIISKRLDRERRLSDSLKQVKDMLIAAKNDGLIEGESFSQMAKEFMLMSKKAKEQRNDDTAEDNTPMPCDNTPSIAEEGGETTLPQAAKENTKEETEGDFFSELRAIREKHGGKDMDGFLSGDLFEKFAKGRRGRASEIFDDFCLFMRGISGMELHEEALPEGSLDPYSSTSFSKFSDTESVYSGLTRQQMEMAKSAGLSYREYATILAGIPQKKNKNN